MTIVEFRQQMARLTETYGAKAFPEPRALLVWDEFKSVDAKVFTAIVSRLIGESAFAPMLSKFRELLAVYRERTVAEEKREASAGIERLFNSEETRLIVRGIFAIMDQPDEVVRNKMVANHCGFIDSVFKGRRHT